LRKDVATVFDGGATASTRARATASLAVKAVVILVLGYAAWQEWQIHFIYAQQQAKAQAQKANVEAKGMSMPAPSLRDPVKRDIFGAPLDQTK
jgi:hypothetical protein